MPSIFLSHSWKDKFFARNLAEKLQEAGIKVWIDEAELKVGDSLVHKISDAIEHADYVAAILSHTSVASGWVQKELTLAMTKEIAGRRITVLPILIEKCELPDFLKDKLYADFTDPQNFEEAFSKLLRAIGVTVKPKPATAVASTSGPTVIVGPKPPMAAPPKLEHFEDIVITGVDEHKVYNPNPERRLYNVYFTLSTPPPQEWAQIFEAERRFPRHTMWRHVWVEGQHIVVYCPLGEVKKYHLNDIKQDVINTNRKYREYLKQEAIKEQRERLREEKEKREIDEALEGLDLD